MNMNHAIQALTAIPNDYSDLYDYDFNEDCFDGAVHTVENECLAMEEGITITDKDGCFAPEEIAQADDEYQEEMEQAKIERVGRLLAKLKDIHATGVEAQRFISGNASQCATDVALDYLRGMLDQFKISGGLIHRSAKVMRNADQICNDYHKRYEFFETHLSNVSVSENFGIEVYPFSIDFGYPIEY